jgi:hypothetical protein
MKEQKLRVNILYQGSAIYTLYFYNTMFENTVCLASMINIAVEMNI